MSDIFKAIDDLIGSNVPKEAFIRQAYRLLLLREPDVQSIKHHMPKERDSIVADLIGSKEFRELARTGRNFQLGSPSRRRVVLFGAYGNGNVGDSIQAASLRRHLQVVRPDLEVWAYSEIPGRFEFRYDRVLPEGAFLRDPILKQFDAIIIGGGGLLSHPHAPLFDERWQSMVSIPVIILGVGASKPVCEQSGTLLAKASYVSGRDTPSVEALRAFRADVHEVPDPVLCDPFYQRTTTGTGTLFIIKHADERELAAARRHFDPARDSACFIEPSLDITVGPHFREAVPVSSVADLLELIDAHEVVVSARYHGCILALLRGKTVIGIREQKTRELLARYAGGSSFYSAFSSMKGAIARSHKTNEQLLADDRCRLLSALNAALEAAGV